ARKYSIKCLKCGAKPGKRVIYHCEYTPSFRGAVTLRFIALLPILQRVFHTQIMMLLEPGYLCAYDFPLVHFSKRRTVTGGDIINHYAAEIPSTSRGDYIFDKLDCLLCGKGAPQCDEFQIQSSGIQRIKGEYSDLYSMGAQKKLLEGLYPPYDARSGYKFAAGSPSEENALDSAQSWSTAIQAALMPVTPQSSIGGQKRGSEMSKLKVPND
ncbi:hypothetical protein ANCDUO_19408, partial [Ancylostoma duodenale]